MAIERLAPDAILAQTNLSGAVTAIDEDPDSADASWLTAPGSNNATAVRVSFPTPSGPLTTGAGVQNFRVQVRKTAHSTNPTCTIELYENGTLISTLVSGTAVSSTTGTVIQATWDATGRTASQIECRVSGTVGGGSPGNRASLEVGAIEWNATYSTSSPGTANANLVTISATPLAATASFWNGKTLQLVVGNGSSPVSGDVNIHDYLVSLGYAVNYIDQTATANTTGIDGVVISESCSSGTVAGKYDAVTVPVLSFEQAIFNEMHLAAVDGTDTSPVGTLDVIDSSTPLADGQTGTITVTDTTTSLPYVASSNLGSGVIAYLSQAGNSSQVSGFAYDSGASMSGATAPAKRGYLPFKEVQWQPGWLNATGKGLVEAWLTWALTSGTPGNATANLVTISTSALAATATVNPFNDGFESGDTSQWDTLVATAPDTITVVSGSAHDGSFGLHINEALTGTPTYVRKSFTATDRIKVAGWFRSPTVGASGNNNANIRIFSAGVRILDMYRQNENGGLWLRTRNNAGTNVFTRLANDGYASTNEWYHLELLVEYGGVGTVSHCQAWVDGVEVLDSSVFDLDSGAYDQVQLGAEHPNQYVDLDVDEVSIDLDPSTGTPGDATASLVSVSASPLASTATGKGSATAGLASVSASALSATGSGQGSAICGLAQITLTPLAATASGGTSIPGNATANLVTISLSALTATATGSAVASANLHTISFAPQTASASGAAAQAVALQSVAVSALAPSATGAATAGAALPAVGVSALAATASGAAVANANLVVVSVTALAASATGGASIPGTADTNLVTLSLSPITAASWGDASAQVSTPVLTLTPLSVAPTGAGTAQANLVVISLSALSATASGGAGAVAPTNLVSLTVTPLPATATGKANATAGLVGVTVQPLISSASGGGAGAANTGLVSLSITALSATAHGAASAQPGLGSAQVQPLTSTAVGAAIAAATGGTVTTSGPGSTAHGAGDASTGLVGLTITPLAATATGCGSATPGLPVVGVIVLPATGSAPGSAVAGLQVLTLVPLAIERAGVASDILVVGSQMPTLRGVTTPTPTLLGRSSQLRTISGLTSSGPTLGGSCTTEPTLTGTTGSTE